MWMFLGVALYSVVVGALTIMVLENTEKTENLMQKLTALEEFKKQSELPDDIYKKIRVFIQENFEEISTKVVFDQMINEIPPTLKEELIFYQYGRLINDF